MTGGVRVAYGPGVAQLPFTFRSQVRPQPDDPSEPHSSGVVASRRGRGTSTGRTGRTAPADPLAEEDPRAPVTVSALCKRLHATLERAYPQVAVVGEISRFKRHDSGHAYFTLKDRHARIDAVMWARVLGRSRFVPEEGMEVICRGRPSVFGRNGRLQLVVAHLEPHGVGALHAEFRQRLEDLRADGLLDPARKRPLPRIPRRIGIVTSRDGAALHDVLRTLWSKDPAADLVLSATPVQGRGAAPRVAEALRRLDRTGACDVILLVRGGGSLEDLWAFNERPVLEAVTGASVPVVCGVGHESDVTLAELVADVRAATPTAAAEAAACDRAAERLAFERVATQLDRAAHQRLRSLRHRLAQLEHRLPPVDGPLWMRRQQLDELVERLHHRVSRRLRRYERRVVQAERRLGAQAPSVRCAAARGRLERAEGRLSAALESRRAACHARLSLAAGRLEAHSPLKVLARGYAVVQRPGGDVIRAADQLRPTDPVEVRLHRGRITAEVTSVSPEAEVDETS
jgi:exodeoxyribonuclease VII large subunit